MPDRTTTLSLCIIVRDAEQSLAAALDSARPFVDETIVVDTGSIDETRKIAQARGAQLFEFAWCDDFSASRNHSLAQATSDWIFWMDADDILPPESGHKLRQAIDDCPGRDAAFWVTVEEEAPAIGRPQPRVMGHAHVKLFPRDPRIRFRYHVHEQVAPSIRAAGLPIRPSGAVVRHLRADRSSEAQRARLQRNLRLSLLDLLENPDDPFVLLSLGATYLFLEGSLHEAIDYLERSVAACNPGSETQLNAWLYLGQALGTSGERQREEEAYRQALERFPDDVSLRLRLGGLYERRGRLADAAASYAAVLKSGRVRASAVHLRGGYAEAALRLGELHTRAGQRARAERLWRDYLQRHPAAEEVREALAKSYLNPCSIIVGPSGKPS